MLSFRPIFEPRVAAPPSRQPWARGKSPLGKIVSSLSRLELEDVSLERFALSWKTNPLWRNCVVAPTVRQEGEFFLGKLFASSCRLMLEDESSVEKLIAHRANLELGDKLPSEKYSPSFHSKLEDEYRVGKPDLPSRFL